MGSAGTAISSRGGLLFNMIAHRHQQLPRRRDVQQRQSGYGLGELLGCSQGAAAGGRAGGCLAANPNIVPGADILKIYDVRGVARWADRAQQDLVFRLVATGRHSINICSATTTPTAARCSTTT